MIPLYRSTNPEWLLYRQGNDYFEEKEFEKATEFYHQSIQKGLSDPDAFRSMGNAYVVMGNFDDAIEVYRKYLEIKPRDHQVRLLLAKVLNWNHNYEEAEKEFNIILENSKK